MTSGVKDIQLLELKDTILQLNKTISEQNNLIVNLQQMLEERNTSDAKKDQIISNLQAQMTVFSMIETAKANGPDPKKYLNYLLDQRPSFEMTDEELDQLMPWSEPVITACSKQVE